MTNASFYRLKINYWLVNKLFSWWPTIDLVAGSWHCWLLVLDIVGWFLILLAASSWHCLLVIDIIGCWFLTLFAGYWYCWLVKTSLLTLELEPFVPWKMWEIFLAFQQKKPELIWASRTQDMSWKPNSVRAAGQVSTSPLFLRYELENGRIESWTLYESFRSMS